MTLAQQWLMKPPCRWAATLYVTPMWARNLWPMECKTSGSSSLCTACQEDCGHIMIQKLDNNGTMEGTCHEWDDFTAGATPTLTQEPAHMYTRAESLQAQCNTVCKPHMNYNSKDNVSDKFLIPLSMTSCLGQVGSNCKPEACDDKLCMDALAPPPPPPTEGGGAPWDIMMGIHQLGYMQKRPC